MQVQTAESVFHQKLKVVIDGLVALIRFTHFNQIVKIDTDRKFPWLLLTNRFTSQFEIYPEYRDI